MGEGKGHCPGQAFPKEPGRGELGHGHSVCARTPGGGVGVGVGFSATNEEYRLVISEPRLFCLYHSSINKHLPIGR